MLCFIVDKVTFRVVWKKNNYSVTFPVDEKAVKLKEHIQTLTGIKAAHLYSVRNIQVLFCSNYVYSYV